MKYECKQFASEFEKLLLKKNLKGKRLCVKNRGRGGIGSLRFKNISHTNEHVAVRVGDLVFDNLYHEGIPYAEWVDDLGINEIESLELQEQEIGSEGCL